MIIEKTGNIFTTKAQTIVNTVNCVGVMGAGIAYEFRLREPEMFEKYRVLCNAKQLDIGKLWLYKLEEKESYGNYNAVLNFPTKYHWKYPSKEEYLHKGLEKFLATYEEKGITSVAFPMLGADRGGLDGRTVLGIMESYLKDCSIDVEIWQFDPMAKDDLYENFRNIFAAISDEKIKEESDIKIHIVKKIREALQRKDINSLSGLLRVKGVGEGSLEKLFSYMQSSAKNNLFT